MHNASLYFYSAFIFIIFGLAGYLLAGGSNIYVLSHLSLGLLAVVFGCYSVGSRFILHYIQRSFSSLRKIVLGIVLLGITATLLIGVNILAAGSTWRYDTTEGGVFSLSGETVDIINKLDEPVTLHAVVTAKPHELYRRKELLTRYQELKPQFIKIELLDPLREPQKVAALGISSGDVLALVFAEETPILLKSAEEQEVTAVFVRRLLGSQRVVYFLAGHGEPSIDSLEPEGLSQLKEVLKAEQISARPLLLAEQGVVPDDAASVAVVAPLESIPAAEIQVLKDYVRSGGNVALFFEPTVTTELFDFAKTFGIQALRGVVLDKTQRLFDAPEIGWQITTRSYGEHQIVSGMADTDLTVFLMGVPLQPVTDLARRYSLTPIVRAAGTAWGETNLTALFADPPIATYDEGEDVKGPVVLGMSAEIQQQDNQTSRVLVYGDSTWIRNQNVSVYANDSLAARSFLWSINEKPQIVVRPRSFRRSVLLVSSEAFRILLLASFLVPEVIFLLGVFVWWRRTRSSAAVSAGLSG